MQELRFEEIYPTLYRLKVPFENIYAAVFLVKTECGCMLFDTGAKASDVTDIIIPALRENGVSEGELKYIFCSHAHGDHAGGLRTLVSMFPSACVLSGSMFVKDRLSLENHRKLTDGEELLPNYTAMYLPGHTGDMFCLFDTKTKTLISSDALQLCGITKYGCGLDVYDSYIKTLDRLLGSDVECIIASHEYYPLGAVAKGKEKVAEYISECRRYVEYIAKRADEFIGAGILDKTIVCDSIREENARKDKNIPTLQYHTVAGYIKSRTT